MKKIVTLILVFVFGNLLSQYRFVYRVDFKIDSLNRDFVQSESFNLDIDGKESVFYPTVFLKLDSIYNATGTINKKNIPDAKLDYIIKKNYRDGSIHFREMIGATIYETTEPRKISWVHTNETSKYHSYNVKKAITRFAGKQWEAWFTEEFPINDGPYKFSGLPGMILKMKDTHSDYEIYLVEVKKIERPISFELFKKLKIKTLNTDYATYLRKKKEFAENPALMFIEMGIQLPAEEMKQFSETRKNIEAKQNNKIELVY
ncbi:GLPGLI family protein [Bergeyella zoohelcum]|uniref:GLPGLI family protein n=1 Tax=Bergeyella zoohelcum ATCC 43767 TaxID=883096 RepID=K1M6Q3_9FLAO|nr:GLPGLI family protein [Bergeyella zoohelcum]EKB58043.1 hypothetical protein HMPREF9699_00701 [Bergeyella zoohelcum ATCC 43767]SUV49113.1 GLPGLI family protein [Bergeyella zoohelcum]